jgi:hypothetical protein
VTTTTEPTPTATKARPSYLGLLNAIAEAEMHGYGYLKAWAEQTGNPEVRAKLLTVAAREAEHGMTFARRINELGFEVRPRQPDEDAVRRAEVATSDRSDLEKLELLGYGAGCDQSKPDQFDRWFEDHSIDPVTGALLGRFVCEERDSVRIFHSCWELCSI